MRILIHEKVNREMYIFKASIIILSKTWLRSNETYSTILYRNFTFYSLNNHLESRFLSEINCVRPRISN